MVCLDTSFVIDFLKNNKEAVEKEKEFEKSESISIASPTITELIRGWELNIRQKRKKKK